MLKKHTQYAAKKFQWDSGDVYARKKAPFLISFYISIRCAEIFSMTEIYLQPQQLSLQNTYALFDNRTKDFDALPFHFVDVADDLSFEHFRVSLCEHMAWDLDSEIFA